MLYGNRACNRQHLCIDPRHEIVTIDCYEVTLRIIPTKELLLTPRYFVLFWTFFIFWCVLVPIYVSEVTPGIYYEEKD